MKILVVNCGSSSLKYQVINMTDESVLVKGLVERIGIDGSRLKHEKTNAPEILIERALPNHTKAIELVLETLVDKEHGVLGSMSEVAAVGHRVVHGGEAFSSSVLVTDEVIAAIEECSDLAPLHNPANIMGIRACRSLMPETPMVVVFDTAFHQTMPAENYIYALPYEYYEKFKVRRYGFHGTSHKYVSEKAAELLNAEKKDLRIVTCHLGNGASLAAIQGGKCIDTSMGLTPLEGLVMGTRCGDLDPAILPFLMKKENLDPDAMSTIMNKKSGVLGISGVSSDFRDIETAAEQGNERAKLALTVFSNRVRKYIAAYASQMGGLDVLIFTAGLGENSDIIRKTICQGLEFMGVDLDAEKNTPRSKEPRQIQKSGSKVTIMVIPTNEELVIARDARRITQA